MLFNSFAFLLFLPAVFFLFWALRPAGVRAQNVLLIAASYYFYGLWDYRFLALLFGSSLIDFLVGRQLSATTEQRRRRVLIGISLVTQLGLLCFFKYYGFFVDSFVGFLGSFGMHTDVATLRIILPVGISFYTFQTLSYTIDVYRQELSATRDPVAFFAFVSFFPQLVAGPIERAARMLPQFQLPRTFDVLKAKDGLRQMLWGFFKKIVIADNLAGQVHNIFAASDHAGSGMLHLGALLFAFQIYCDFSGYSDIAIGCARLFGVDLMRNFAFPYFSRSIGEFWRRWHIALSTWFRDYVYIPLGGNRVSRAKRVRNIVATFALSGLWHGAAWTYVAWGLLNGLLLVPSALATRAAPTTEIVAAGRWLPSPGDVLRIGITFYLTLIAWVFFRADSLQQAFSYVGRMLSLRSTGDFSVPRPLIVAELVFIAVLVVAEWVQRHRQHALSVERLSLPVRWGVYVAVSVAIVLFGNFGHVQFIYFQF